MSRYSDLVIADGGANLLGYWTLGATNGLTDLSSGGNNGTAAGTGFTAASIGTATGPGELTATDFPGVDQRVTTGLAPFTNGTVRSFEWWANLDSIPANRVIIGSSGTVAKGFAIYVGTDGKLYLYWNSVNQASWTVTSLVGSFHHGMVVFDESGDTARALIDGASVGTVAAANPYVASMGNLQIGSLQSTNSPMDGRICHPAIYNGDKSALANVHYNAGLWALRSATGPAPWFSAP